MESQGMHTILSLRSHVAEFDSALSDLAVLQGYLDAGLPDAESYHVYCNARSKLCHVFRSMTSELDRCAEQLQCDEKTRRGVDAREVIKISLQRPGPEPLTELYRLRPHLVQEVLKTTRLRPQVDAFILRATRQCPRWWGPDSEECQDAFGERWNQCLLWCNPPYSRMGEVV